MKIISNSGFIALLEKTNGSVWFAVFQKQKRLGRGKGSLITAIAVLILSLTMNIAVASVSAPEILQEQKNPPAQGESAGNKGSKAGASDIKINTRNSSNIVLNSEEEYRISPNDLVEIKIDKAEELSGTFVINKSGSFTMKFLGRILAQGKTSEELATQIADGLRGKYLIDPTVRVTILQQSGQSYFVQGAVRFPGMFQIQGSPTLLELITIAGGLADNHGSTAFVIRKIKQPQAGAVVKVSTPDKQPAESPDSEGEIAKFELVKANISGLLRGNFNNNIMIEPGDIITIPVTDVFFVAGEITAPGSFPLKDGTTLRQAISLAQGTTFKAKTGAGIIYREDSVTGKRQEIKVDIGAVMSGKKEDIPIMANDVILLPNSRMKSIGNALLTTFGFSATRLGRF